MTFNVCTHTNGVDFLTKWEQRRLGNAKYRPFAISYDVYAYCNEPLNMWWFISLIKGAVHVIDSWISDNVLLPSLGWRIKYKRGRENTSWVFVTLFWGTSGLLRLIFLDDLQTLGRSVERRAAWLDIVLLMIWRLTGAHGGQTNSCPENIPRSCQRLGDMSKCPWLIRSFNNSTCWIQSI